MLLLSLLLNVPDQVAPRPHICCGNQQVSVWIFDLCPQEKFQVNDIGRFPGTDEAFRQRSKQFQQGWYFGKNIPVL